MLGELQSLCEPCHKSAKRQIELRGYTVTSGSTATRPIRIIRSIGQDSSADWSISAKGRPPQVAEDYRVVPKHREGEFGMPLAVLTVRPDWQSAAQRPAEE